MAESTSATDNTPDDNEFSFQAEVSELLKLMVHSVYSDKEIFLRELISNASDACDKLRYEAITKPNLMANDADLAITVKADKSAGTLSIIDNGIGMSRDELIENLGTIAHSGTKAFLQNINDNQDKNQLIGQFGVGFYSAFMVADQVKVTTTRAGTDQTFIWTSDGATGFAIEEGESPNGRSRGTNIELKLRDDAKEFLQPHQIQRIVRTYSDHISFPILLIDAEKPDEEPQKLNTASALWTRSKSELSEDDYKTFYRDVAGQFDEPKITIHYRAEGRHEYSVLLFVPAMRPFDLYDPERSGRVKLYVRRVFIADNADILPPYLRFVRGVIDSEDMPLNISREMLQENPIVASIRKAVINRVLSEIKKFSEKDADAYQSLWETFGGVLKEGIYEDPERRDGLFELSLFRSTQDDGWISLKSYVENMKPEQTAIYYLVADTLDQAKASPQLEGFRARDVNVLLLTDPVDNFWVTTATGFEGKPFQSVSQGQADLSALDKEEDNTDDKDAEDAKTIERDVATLVAKLKTTLADAVSDVQVSERLVKSPACLVAEKGAPDRAMEKILERQDKSLGLKPVLEINKTHPFVKALSDRLTGQNENFDDLAWLLFDEAKILDGEPPSNPAKFAERLNRLLFSGE